MTVRSRPARMLALLATVLMMVTAIAGQAMATPVGTPTSEAPKEGGTLTVAITDEPDTLDPHKTGAAVTQAIMRNVCDPLIAKDLDGNYVPGLAKEWAISPDGLTWSFALRDDVTFQDGTPFNAAAVKASFDRIVDPATKSALASGLVGQLDSVTVTGDYAVELKLKEPFAPLLDNLTNDGALCVVSPDAVQKEGDDFGRKPVATGPFMVDEWQSGDHITLKKNPNYQWAPSFLHQGSPAHLDQLVFRIITEDAARVAAFEAGEIDETSVPATDVNRIKESGDFWTVDYLRKGVVFFEFNVTKAPFDDLKVRQAFNSAIDKQEVLDAAVEGLGQVAYGFLSPSIWGYWPGIVDYAPKYDPDKAKSLLAEAGWTDTDGDGVLDKNGQPFKFTAFNLTLDAWNRAAQVIQSQLKDIGIQMEIQNFEFGTVLDKLKAGEQQAEFMGYTYTEPDIAYLWFHSSNIGTGLNFSHDNDPTLDALIMKGRTTTDLEARAKVYEDLQKYVVDQALWVPLWIDQYTEAYNKRVHGAQFHPDAYTVYFDAWVD
jgi:peptide/nickel transport system substrate-binding protein